MLLLIYAGAVLGWAALAGGDVPLADSAFLPVLGHVNSHFFSEAGSLTFLTFVIPPMGCVSGILYYLNDRVLRAANPVSA